MIDSDLKFYLFLVYHLKLDPPFLSFIGFTNDVIIFDQRYILTNFISNAGILKISIKCFLLTIDHKLYGHFLMYKQTSLA